MESTLSAKSVPGLSLRERYDIFRTNRYVSIFFPFAILLLIIFIFEPLTGGQFLGRSVILGILNQGLIVGTMAIGVAFIYSTGNLDISVGSVMTLSAVVGTLVYNATTSVILMIVACSILSIFLMLFNCTLSTLFSIKTVTAAIVMTRIYSAVSSNIIGASTLKVDYNMCRALENGGFRYVSFFTFLIIAYVIFHHTRIGRADRVIGGNPVNAVQTGLSPNKFLYVNFIMAGISIGLAAVYTIIRAGAVSSDTGSGIYSDVMLATVLGGMSIFGGSRSNSYAGVVGALTVVALNKGMLMMGVSNTVIQGIRGVIFLILVYLNSEKQTMLPSRQQF